MIRDLMENVRLLLNRIRIWWLELTTDRVRRFEVTDEKGQKHKATTVTEETKVCAHKRIEEIAPTMWRCLDCPDVYFQISYKVMLAYSDLVSFTESIADHMGARLHDKHAPEPDK